jgi:hypothetical protein
MPGAAEAASLESRSRAVVASMVVSPSESASVLPRNTSPTVSEVGAGCWSHGWPAQLGR